MMETLWYSEVPGEGSSGRGRSQVLNCIFDQKNEMSNVIDFGSATYLKVRARLCKEL